MLNQRSLTALIFATGLLALGQSQTGFAAGSTDAELKSNDQAAASLAQRGHRRAAHINGIAVTGWNRILGEPAADLRFVGNLSFAVAGVYNPDGPALPVTNDTSMDALMATYANPDVYAAFFGIQGAENITTQNILYRDVAHVLDNFNTTGPIPQLQETDTWWEINNGAENADYTVGDWLAASGRVNFFCNPAQGPHYTVRMRDLIPGGLYTLWAFYFNQQTGNLHPGIPFGGTSANVFVADRNGRLNGDRALNVCPMDIAPEEDRQLVTLVLIYHTNGQVEAGVDLVFDDPPVTGPGITATPQLFFPFPEQF